MPTTRGNQGQAPINSDTYNLTADLATLIDSLQVVVTVANDAAGDSVATSRASAGFAVTDARPLFIYNQATNSIRWKGTAAVWSELSRAIKHAEFTSAGVTQTANSGQAFGVFTADGTRTFNNTFCSPNSAGTLNILESGSYLLTSYVQPPSSLGTQVHLWATSTTEGTIMSTNFISYGNNGCVCTVEVYLPAGSTITLGVTGSNTVSGILSRVKLAKILGA